jgi:hypothetical protein
MLASIRSVTFSDQPFGLRLLMYSLTQLVKSQILEPWWVYRRGPRRRSGVPAGSIPHSAPQSAHL